MGHVVERPGYGLEADIAFDQINVADYEAVLLLGGRAPEYLRNDAKLLDTIRAFDRAGKWIFSICHGIQVLAAAGAEPDQAWKVDGVNLLPVWEGRSPAPERTLFWEWRSEGSNQLAAMRGALKLVITNGGRPEAVTADLGKRWELEQIALRLWPSASLMQGMNTALFEILAKQAIDPAKVKTVRVTLPQMAFDMHGKLPVYKGKFEALISAHYTAAVILHDRSLTLAEFEPAR